MKVGIITFHRAHNYGAVLQCYALQEKLKELGHDVRVIDYRQETIEDIYKFHPCSFDKNSLIRKNIGRGIIYIIKYVVLLIKQYRNSYLVRKNIFKKFSSEYLNIDKHVRKKNILPDYDIYVIGSDMLWSKECLRGKYDPVYFGEFKRNKYSKIVGYAISTTQASIEECVNNNFWGYLENFASLSVREKEVSNFIKNNISIKIQTCIDPTLLGRKEIWNRLINNIYTHRKYILTYFLHLPHNEKGNMFTKIQKYANEHSLEIINVETSHMSLSVSDFVSIIRYSTYVITDSFHGVVFSTIFHRPLHAVTWNDANDLRYVDILKQIGMENNCVNKDFEPFMPIIDYEKVDNNLNKIKKDSEIFLKESLN